MGFLSCFGCGSEKDEAVDEATKTNKNAVGTDAERARDVEKPKPTNAAEPTTTADPAPKPGDETLPPVDVGTADQSAAANKSEPKSPEQRFGAQHRIDDDKVQQAMHNNPYPVSPVAADSTTSLSEGHWHDATE